MSSSDDEMALTPCIVRPNASNQLRPNRLWNFPSTMTSDNNTLNFLNCIRNVPLPTIGMLAPWQSFSRRWQGSSCHLASFGANHLIVLHDTKDVAESESTSMVHGFRSMNTVRRIFWWFNIFGGVTKFTSEDRWLLLQTLDGLGRYCRPPSCGTRDSNCG